ncbi:hypothetical protein ROHU_026506 [Labeo rohita]|uniref:Uncharacterized protein n=1 Tax=Labeo rohita TaxID=84645 RepID=A0A498MG92_LABRO|nr:hypothetical protein ROHU_026506 [Labeo rohita]
MILQKKRAREDRLSEGEEDYADVPETPLFDSKDEEGELMMRRTPQMKRKRLLTRLTVKQEERNVTAPMIEVLGPDGPMMVFRPWTALEAREAMVHLPDVGEGGDKMSTELQPSAEGGGVSSTPKSKESMQASFQDDGNPSQPEDTPLVPPRDESLLVVDGREQDLTEKLTASLKRVGSWSNSQPSSAKLPHDLRANFKRFINPLQTPIPTLLDFADWLEYEVRVQVDGTQHGTYPDHDKHSAHKDKQPGFVPQKLTTILHSREQKKYCKSQPHKWSFDNGTRLLEKRDVKNVRSI